MVCRIFIDIEYTNGNYYLCDILEIAAFSNKSDRSFQTYVRTFYKVPKGVEELTGITMKICLEKGVSLKCARRGLDVFIRNELESSFEPIRIVSHGGTHGDFPLLALAIEKSFGDAYITSLQCISRAAFIDSMRKFQSLDTPSQEWLG